MRRIAYWIVFAITLALSVALFAWSIPGLVADAGGLAPFDLRSGGYSLDEARTLVSAYSPDGIAFYLGVQHMLDLFYPAFLAASIYFAIAYLLPARLGGWRYLIAAIAIPGAIFDYLENAAVRVLLTTPPADITAEQVATASQWTLIKGGFITVSVVLLLLLLLWRLYGRVFKKPLAPQY